jgi:peptidoglycan/LPS O-acetylase OafA/YrhL
MGDHKKSSGNKPYFAGLDGLRAVAVVAVVLYHLFPALIPGGFIGVDIFFVISGFLITSLLINEKARTGKIDLKGFWTRRARRLLPALFTTIGVACSVALFIGGDALVGLGRQVLGAATFSNNWVEVFAGTNYFNTNSLHLFTNFWSLAVEEQFYALWPFTLVAILGVGVALRRYRIGLWLSLALSLCSAGLMFALFSEAAPTRVYYGTDTHAFGLMLGAALAFLGNVRYEKALQRGDKWPSARFKRRRLLQTFGLLSFGGIIALVAYLPELSPVTYRGGLLLASALTGIVILAAVNNKGLLRRFLEQKWIKWIGVRSYGIYLWHWPLIVLCHYGLPPQTMWAMPIIVSFVSITAAALSYRFLEQPVRGLGIRAFMRRGIGQWVKAGDNLILKRRFVPHPLTIVTVGVVVMTALAITAAPSKTQAQQRIETAMNSVNLGQLLPSKTARSPVKKPKKITGRDMVLVGDSVSLASAPELQAEFPGIYIDAAVSRSMRNGGLETVERIIAKKQLRRILVVSLGTNGYLGDDTVQQLLREVGKNCDVVFVTAHAPVEWVDGNNDYIRQIAKKHPDVFIADWDAAINARPELLGPDDIHPGPTGGELYAHSIAGAISKIRQNP